MISPDAKLGELVTFQRGFDITKKEQTEGSVPVFSSGGIASYHNESKVKGAGIIIGRKGTLGTVFYSEHDYWPHDTTLWVKDFKGNDPKFIYYFLKTLQLERFDAGAANPTLNRNHIHNLTVSVPTKENRTFIATILSAYDELIANNSQRIKLLEEMAEEIYKEWFVRLRFPGHEQTPIVDGLPEGWEIKSFEDVAEYVNGYAFKPDDWSTTGFPIIKIAELKNGVTDKTPKNSGKDVPEKLYVQTGDLLFSWSADLDAYIWGDGNALLNQHLFKVNPYDKDLKYFLYLSLKEKMQLFRNMSNGATMQHIKKSELGRIFLNLPKATVLQQFKKVVDSQIEELLVLKEKNKLLKQTSNLLLPRLMSGRLSVDHLPEP